MWSSKVLLLVATIVHLVVGHEHNCTSYKIGDPVKLQCKEIDNAGNAVWGPGPTCVQVIIELSNWVDFFQTRKELVLPFGLDSFVHCGWEVPNQKEFSRLRNLLARNGITTRTSLLLPPHLTPFINCNTHHQL